MSVRLPNYSRQIPYPRNRSFRTDCGADGHNTGYLFRLVDESEQPKEPPTAWRHGLSDRYGKSGSDVLHSSHIQSNVPPACCQATDRQELSRKDNRKNPLSPKSRLPELQKILADCNIYAREPSSAIDPSAAETPFPNNYSYRKVNQYAGRPVDRAYDFSYHRRHAVFSSPA